MIKIFPLVLIFLLSCNSKEKPNMPFPLPVENVNGWIIYEGRVPLDEERNLYIEVSMLPASGGSDGNYELKEFLEEDNMYSPLSNFKGKYSTLYGATHDELIVQLHNSGQIEGVKRVYYNTSANPVVRTIKEEYIRKTNLFLKSKGDNLLIVLDKRSEPITLDAGYNLFKRTSRLFTVEGYITHNGDSAIFLETNTNEKWGVSKLGAYRQAIKQYHQLAANKLEGIYVKAIGYTVTFPTKEGTESDALVLKKILQMTSAPISEPDVNVN